MKFFSLIIFALLISFAHASEASSSFSIKKIELLNPNLLDITLEDGKEVANSCDYFVKRFEYLETVQTILLEVSKNPCFVDRFGKGTAHFFWELPSTFKTKKNISLTLLINADEPRKISVPNTFGDKK